MYRAIRLYPGNYDGMKEHLLITEGVKYRFNALKEAVKHDRGAYGDFTRAMNYSLEGIMAITQLKCYPTLDIYLKLAEVFSWNLSRDVNYAYAEVLYPPEELIRRCRRVITDTPHLNILSYTIQGKIGYDLPTIADTLTYGKWRCSMCYGRLMLYVRERERLMQYHDALDFEE